MSMHRWTFMRLKSAIYDKFVQWRVWWIRLVKQTGGLGKEYKNVTAWGPLGSFVVKQPIFVKTNWYNVKQISLLTVESYVETFLLHHIPPLSSRAGYRLKCLHNSIDTIPEFRYLTLRNINMAFHAFFIHIDKRSHISSVECWTSIH